MEKKVMATSTTLSSYEYTYFKFKTYSSNPGSFIHSDLVKSFSYLPHNVRRTETTSTLDLTIYTANFKKTCFFFTYQNN